MDEQQTPGNAVQVSKETLWYLDNYILLKDYLDRTISRIAARCIRQNNIAMEEYSRRFGRNKRNRRLYSGS